MTPLKYFWDFYRISRTKTNPAAGLTAEQNGGHVSRCAKPPSETFQAYPESVCSKFLFLIPAVYRSSD
jgi:hypothetical protein